MGVVVLNSKISQLQPSGSMESQKIIVLLNIKKVIFIMDH